jgi:hypothetical protein
VYAASPAPRPGRLLRPRPPPWRLGGVGDVAAGWRAACFGRTGRCWRQAVPAGRGGRRLAERCPIPGGYIIGRRVLFAAKGLREKRPSPTANFPHHPRPFATGERFGFRVTDCWRQPAPPKGMKEKSFREQHGTPPTAHPGNR